VSSASVAPAAVGRVRLNSALGGQPPSSCRACRGCTTAGRRHRQDARLGGRSGYAMAGAVHQRAAVRPRGSAPATVRCRRPGSPRGSTATKRGPAPRASADLRRGVLRVDRAEDWPRDGSSWGTVDSEEAVSSSGDPPRGCPCVALGPPITAIPASRSSADTAHRIRRRRRSQGPLARRRSRGSRRRACGRLARRPGCCRSQAVRPG
jgi:hypothetical protein